MLEIDRKLIHLVKSAITKSKSFKSSLLQIPYDLSELVAYKLSFTAEAFEHVSIDSDGNVVSIVSNIINLRVYCVIILYFHQLSNIDRF